MPAEYKPKTDKEKIEFLMATDDRREKHNQELKLDIKNLTTNVSNLTMAIVGSDLNGNKGILSFVNKVELRIDNIEKDIELTKTIDSKNKIYFDQFKWVFGIVSATIIVALVGIFMQSVKNANQLQNVEKMEIAR